LGKILVGVGTIHTQRCIAVSERQPNRDLSEIARPAPDEPSLLDPADITRYDALLATIPLALLAAWVAGQVAPIPEWVALGIGALVAVPALVDGLVLHPPA